MKELKQMMRLHMVLLLGENIGVSSDSGETWQPYL